MQSLKTTGRPSKSHGRAGTKADVGKSCAAPAALAGYNALMLPTIPAGVIPGRIDSGNPFITADACIAMHAAGWNTIPARQNLTPAHWFHESVQHYLSRFLPPKPQACGLSMDFGIHVSEEGEWAYISLSASTDGHTCRHIGELAELAHASYGIGPSLLKALGTEHWVITPQRIFEIVSNLYWYGEDDEEFAAQEHSEPGEEYNGYKRADFERTFPEWAFNSTAMYTADKCVSNAKLKNVARTAPHPFNVIAEQCLALRVLSQQNFVALPGTRVDIEELGVEELWPYTGAVYWRENDNLTEAVSDEHYQYAMQGSAECINAFIKIPKSLTRAEAVNFIRGLELDVQRFAAVSRLFGLLKWEP